MSRTAGRFFAQLAVAYQNELRAQNAVDFDDLLLLAEQVLREHEDVREHFRKQFTRVTVDEFQDTNALQMRCSSSSSAAVSCLRRRR
jgi:DNA helicase II / ATP-dependent DNA helicase PcrA